MFSPELQGQLAKEQMTRASAHARLHSQPIRPVPSPRPAPTIRRAVGRRFIAIGDWLAAESPLESVRSR